MQYKPELPVVALDNHTASTTIKFYTADDGAELVTLDHVKELLLAICTYLAIAQD
jgi:hypothetical protein